jgi:two-component system phosphate regulon sensor histidine kinase PhoR
MIKTQLFQGRFPWRIFSRIVLFQSLVLLTSFFGAGLAVRFYFKTSLSRVIDPLLLQRTLHFYDLGLGLFLGIMGLVLCFFAYILARRLVFPLKRILLRAKNLLSQERGSVEPENAYELDELGEEAFGEWSDLESSIKNIRNQLEKKTESLSLEREELATLMSAISEAILAVDLEGVPLFFNSRFALLFEKRDLNSKKHFWELFREPEILDAFQNSLRDGTSNSIKAVSFEQPSGKRFFSVSTSPLKKDRGAIYGAVGVFHDVTDLVRAEQIRIDFVANVSHELRTPLTAIKGYADTLILDSNNGIPPTTEFLEIITRNTDRLMSLINDLLDLSNLESSDPVQKSRVDTRELTDRVVHQMKGVFEKKKQSVTVQIKTPSVMADPRRIEQVLVNLLDNAHKYTPHSGEILVLWEFGDTTLETDGTKKKTLLNVIDSGPGIQAEHHPRLFERFYRVDKGRSREQGGTGLGLAIVKHIMQGHAGTVRVESHSGSGAHFICSFPD